MNKTRAVGAAIHVSKRARFSPPPVGNHLNPQKLQWCREQLLSYFPNTAAYLPEHLLEKAYNDLHMRPLLLALQDVYSLGLLSFEDYRRAMDNFRPNLQLLELRHYEQLISLMQTADFYLHLGYKLSSYDISGFETPERIILSTALQEIGIGFQEESKRLVWPGISLQKHRLEELFSQLPRTDPSILSTSSPILEQQLRQFERLTQKPGSWIVTLDSFVSKRQKDHPVFTRILSTLAEDRIHVVDLSFGGWPAALLSTIETARSVCFLFCNPIPLGFWTQLASSFRICRPVTVIFLFEPELSLDSEFLHELRAANIPELFIAVDGVNEVGFRPDYDPTEALFSEVLYNPRSFSRALLPKLCGPPPAWPDLPPICWVNSGFYSETIDWFAGLCSSPDLAVRLVTSTKQETNQVWSDVLVMLGLQQTLMKGMKVKLRTDPMATDLAISEFDESTGFYHVSQGTNLLGTNFRAEELEQAYVCVLERLIPRHHDVVVYFSAYPIDRDTIYKLAAASYRKVVILTEPENLTQLLA